MSVLLKKYCEVDRTQSCPSVYQSIAIAQGRPGADQLIIEEFIEMRRNVGIPCEVREWINSLDAYLANQEGVMPVPTKLVCKYHSFDFYIYYVTYYILLVEYYAISTEVCLLLLEDDGGVEFTVDSLYLPENASTDSSFTCVTLLRDKESKGLCFRAVLGNDIFDEAVRGDSDSMSSDDNDDSEPHIRRDRDRPRLFQVI